MSKGFNLTWPIENIKIVSVTRVIKPDSSVNIYLVRMNKNKIFNSIVVYYASDVSDDYVVRDLACRKKVDLKLLRESVASKRFLEMSEVARNSNIKFAHVKSHRIFR